MAASRNTQPAVLKFAAAPGATPIASCCFPEIFTNQIQAAFRELQLLVVPDTRADPQFLPEAFCDNLPTVPLCNHTLSSVLCGYYHPHGKGTHSESMLPRILATWEVIPDLCFYGEQEETEKEAQAAAEKVVTEEQFHTPDFYASQSAVADGTEGVKVPSSPIQQFSPAEDPSVQPVTEDWSAASRAWAKSWCLTMKKGAANPDPKYTVIIASKRHLFSTENGKFCWEKRKSLETVLQRI
ncbi:hypothetical protein U0070_006546 [Myodes glareolus]|uniref:Small ribosomal subunit protein uS2 C-terminal domain-containing protein n=1 Tax=Myodes glareolus TaxID=447135 RepID=A0AAW0JRH3_MYOGA